MRAGRRFRALAAEADRVLVMPVDMPFFSVEWMVRLLEGLEGKRAAMIRWQGFNNALTAAYRLDLLPKLEALVEQGRMRPVFLAEGEPTRVIDVEAHWREGRGLPAVRA